LQLVGREYVPERGLHFYKARYYDAKIGRFINEDPIGFKGGDINFLESTDIVSEVRSG